MRLNNKYLSYGIIKFINGKQLKKEDIVKWLEENFKEELILSSKGEINNATDLISNNWNKFHTWVAKGLNDGTIKGRKISLSNGSGEEKEEWNKLCYEFVSRTNSECFELYKFIQSKNKYVKLGNLFQQFFDTIQTERKFRAGDCVIPFKGKRDWKYHRYYMDFVQIIEEDLIEKFKKYYKGV